MKDTGTIVHQGAWDASKTNASMRKKRIQRTSIWDFVVRTTSCLLIFAWLAIPIAALAQSEGDLASGRVIARKLCSPCHRVLPMSFPDEADPPSFQSIADLPSTTALSLSVFLHSNHKHMPDLMLSRAIRKT
jgi:mono/diheme cytochrome c family protein